MLDKYKELFKIYLRVCKSKYDASKPYDNLEDCCNTCERFQWELLGMLALIESMGKITLEEKEKEFELVLNSFSTHDLFNAYIENGEVMVWSKRD